MIKSMTAFSQGSNTHDTITADITIRSSTHAHRNSASKIQLMSTLSIPSER